MSRGSATAPGRGWRKPCSPGSERPPDTEANGVRRERCQTRTVSVVGEAGERLLGVLVPGHRPLGVQPTALHRLAGRLVGGIAPLLRLLEVAVLGLDDVVGAQAVVLEVAGTAEGSTGHGLHDGSFRWGVLNC